MDPFFSQSSNEVDAEAEAEAEAVLSVPAGPFLTSVWEGVEGPVVSDHLAWALAHAFPSTSPDGDAVAKARG